MRTVKVISINEDKANEDFRYRGTFLHGELETETEFDIFCFEKRECFEVGATDVIIESTGRVATFFLWESIGQHRDLYDWRGYLIYKDDADYEWCKENFLNKKQFI